MTTSDNKLATKANNETANIAVWRFFKKELAQPVNAWNSQPVLQRSDRKVITRNKGMNKASNERT